MHPKSRRQTRSREDHRHRLRRAATVGRSRVYVERNGKRGEAKLDIPKIAVDRPQTLAATVRADRTASSGLDLRVKADTEKDERDALIQRTADERVDRTVISAEQVRAVIANLDRLRKAGIYRDALAYHDLGGLRVTIGWDHDAKPNRHRRVESKRDAAAVPGHQAATQSAMG